MSDQEVHRGKLRELTREVRHLMELNCQTEALLKIAVAFDQWKAARALMHLKGIHELHGPSRALSVFQAGLAERLTRKIKERHGEVVCDKIINALYRMPNNGE